MQSSHILSSFSLHGPPPLHKPTTTRPTLSVKSSINQKPPSNNTTKSSSWVSPDWLTSLSKSLTISKNDESNIPIASAQLDDVSDLLGGALFLPLFKWMNQYGPIYRLAAGTRNFVISFAGQNKMMYLKPLTLYKELLKMKTSKPGLLLCLDVGDKHVTIAQSSEENPVARQTDCILRKNNNIGSMVAEIIQNLMYDYKLAGLVASYPFIKNNENYDGLEIRTLIKELNCTRKFYGLKYTYWDRRLLSKPSNILEKDLLHCFEENGHPYSQTYIQKHEEGFIEDATAATILQGYLDCGRMFYGNV